jgi:hypothetical protein
MNVILVSFDGQQMKAVSSSALKSADDKLIKPLDNNLTAYFSLMVDPYFDYFLQLILSNR